MGDVLTSHGVAVRLKSHPTPSSAYREEYFKLWVGHVQRSYGKEQVRGQNAEIKGWCGAE